MEGGVQLDLGRYFTDFEFKSMMNGGYIIRATLYDAHFNLQSELIREGYFKKSRTSPVYVKFQILWNKESTYPESATKVQEAILVAMEADGTASDKANITFVAIDPPSYYLNIGDAAGTVFKGRVDQVIDQIVKKYAPNIKLEISKTTDSDNNKWWMMRQDPMSFIRSFLDWSSSITQNKTQWIIAADGKDLIIREQSLWPSKMRGYYSVLTEERSTIKDWELLADNALSLVQSKLLSQGVSSISGSYYDRITDKEENKLFVKDKTTSKKKTVKTDQDRSFTKPVDGTSPSVGWSSITSIPEIYSAGELGLKYDDYIDGRARGMFLNLTNSLLRVKFEVMGHGEFSSGMGLGTDTIYIRWREGSGSTDENHKYWWMTGSWLIYGFHHRVTRSQWMTDLYCARHDYDADSIKVGGI